MTESPTRREPAFKAPPIVLLLALSMPALFFFQERLPDMGLSLALHPRRVMEGDWTGLATSMFLHGDWAHAIMNAVGALAFATPVARMLRGGAGAVAFSLFYMACGILSAVGYVLVHPDGLDPVVGASGAVFGLIGASTRIVGPGIVLPLLDRRVLTMCAMWMGVNLVIGLIGLGASGVGARIAWEAHAAGFVVGVLAVGPLGRMFRPRFARIAPVAEPGEGPV
ncbi:MAG TPA: rhomboid family intramembrane serine protease [Brevundimonas sp.]|jgi:membrane associated rhomboid family serine protease|uniref:rhomboid family intramembrane serine protease n=1 Tax=Brevundimonas sp. TaxID=1871086 RepID=UPI002DEA82FF|nr:rhomboid family intramembrane serine protease [Brevundimonas sp.]